MCIHCCCYVQGVADSPSEQCQNGMEVPSEAPAQVKAPSSKRLYNWNTTHFYPDVHKLDDNDTLRQRRHSEPRSFPHFMDTNVSNNQQSSGSTSSLDSFHEVSDTPDTTMPVSQLTVQLSTPPAMNGAIAKVDMDLDSGSESENDFPKTWHRSPLHIRRGRRSSGGGRSGKKTDLLPSADVAGELWKQAADRPSMRYKEQAEKRRKYLQQRCQVYGWDLTTDQQSVVDGHTEEQQQCAASQSQEDIYYIDHSPENDIEPDFVDASYVSVKNRIYQFETPENTHALLNINNSAVKNGTSVHASPPADISVKESSFENIYDAVSLEPDKSDDDVEVAQLYEPRQARVNAVYSYTKPLASTKLPHANLQPSVRAENCIQSYGYQNLSSSRNVADKSVSVAACNVCTARPSSAPGKSMRKSSLDAKSLVEEEKLKFVEYKIEYRRQHSSGNESGSGKSDGERNMKKQSKPSSTPRKSIPPDEYDYILRKIHYNRPQNKAEYQKPSAGQPYQGSELHIEIKKPQMTTHHVTVDVGKPSVPSRVESLQHSGLYCQLPAKPDVIPSPNYPSHANVIAGGFAEGVDISKDLNASPDTLPRTVLHRNYEPVSLPAADERHVCQWDSGIRSPDGGCVSYPKPQHIGFPATTVSQNTEPDRRPPKPPREELPKNRSPDFWHYSTAYEPDSLPQQQQLSQSTLSSGQEMWHSPKTEHKLRGRDLVHDLVRGLDDNSELTREATAVFREQYRWSIHEPCHSVKPDQLKHNQLSQVPCSEVFVSSVCVPSKPVQVVDHTNQPSSKDSSRGGSRKETVFSVTGYHRPQQLKTSSDNDTPRRVYLKDDRVYSTFPDVGDSNYTTFEPEPLYWCSEADKRKPIINSLEVETALNRDCQQQYCDRQTNGRSLGVVSSRNGTQCNKEDTGLASSRRDSYHRDTYTGRDVHRDVRLQGRQKSQDRLVQQMSLGSQEAASHLCSNSSYCSTNHPVSNAQNVHVYAACDNIHREQSSSSSPGRRQLTEVSQPANRQSMKASDHMPSHASSNYEKHILHGQESYRSQVLAQIEPSSLAAAYTTADKSLNADSCRNMASVCTSHSIFKGRNSGRMAVPEIDVCRHNAGIPSDRIVHKAHDEKVRKAYLTKRESEIHADEDSYPVTVAEIKAKLFGPNEDGARKLFQRQTGDVEGCQRGRAGGGTSHCHVAYSDNQQKKRPVATDELTDFEKLVERLHEGEMLLKSHSNCHNMAPSVNAAQCNSSEDPAVKHLSSTNVKVLEDKRGKQSPNLEYTKEWLISGRHASSINSHKSSDHMSYPVERYDGTSTVDSVQLTPAENIGSFISHRQMKSMPCTLTYNPYQHITANTVGSGAVNAVTKSGLLRSTPTDGRVVFRSHLTGPLSSISGSSNNSFVRRSLPALTEKDAELWRNMLSRVQENESRKEAKSRSVERLSQLRCDPEMCYVAGANVKTRAGMPETATVSAERKLAVSAQRLQHSTPNIMMPTDPVSVKPKRQQTPRDVKCRSEFRMKGICANTESRYLDGESDSHISSVADMSKQLPSASSESDELELQRNIVDEGDDEKLAGGSLSFTSVDPASTLVDKNDADEVSFSVHKDVTESPQSRVKQVQKLREDWLSKNVMQSHSSRLSDAPNSLDGGKSNILNKDVAVQHTDSLRFDRHVHVGLGLPNGKSGKPLYVWPLVSTSGCAVYGAPSSLVSGHSDDQRRATTIASTQLSTPSKVSTFEVAFPSQGPSQSTCTGGQSTAVSQLSKVTHIPIRTAVLYSGQSPTRSSAFSPYVEHKDVQISRRTSGGADVTEIKKELIQVKPEQYRASKLSERTVDQRSLKTYQRECEQFRHQRQEVKEPHVKITRQVTDSKTERTYRIESSPHLKVPQLTVRNEPDKFEISDGEMTDATDITLDVMVGANRLLSPTADAVDFSDVEFLSSANLPAKKCGSDITALHESDPSDKNLAVDHKILSDDASADAAITAAKAEMQLYKKNSEAERSDLPVERRRSIKELVHSFEGMTSPFMRVRPRSMEIRISSSSSEEESQNDVVAEGKRKNVKLKASSSFKETTRWDRKSHYQTAMNQ